ncbi:MAG: hypothetical protein F9K49_07085 [Caedimonadaceae bacterium]|nr:MAG: hypothetical protein F9K49_07085 [Caedimonadaceae bacterium]
MKYYFIAFFLLMNASAIAMDDERNASRLPTKMEKQEASSSSDDESDGEPVFLSPISVRQLNPISGVDFTGLTPEERNKALIDALLKANPGLHLPVPKED